MSYINDRAYTDFIHANLAIPLIYQKLNWEKVALDPALAEDLDIKDGIDYVFKDQNSRSVTVQERFRESKYQKYNDFTIRYKRENSSHLDRINSEHFKIKSDFFVYGITNCLKTDISKCTYFTKYAIVNLVVIKKFIQEGLIVLRDSESNFCFIENNKLICPINYNRDGSSSFFPVDIVLLSKITTEIFLLAQEGFEV